MNRVRLQIIAGLLGVLLLAAPGEATELPVTDSSRVAWYRLYYPFIGDWGKIFTIESELGIPEKFRRPDSSKLRPFAFWVSHLPLWHRDKGVGSIRKGQVFPPDSIARAVRLPWRTSRLTDAVIPLQLAYEYLLVRGGYEEWKLAPAKGAAVSYRDWLENHFSFNSDQELTLLPRDSSLASSEQEFKIFFEQLSSMTTYGSLQTNADSVEVKALQPGDLLIGRSESGSQGKVYTILALLQKKKERLFLVGTGCDFACDLFIPKSGPDRANSWLTKEQLDALVASWPMHGYFRLRLPD